jgi:predicted SprT family Zn-dependent metalloprotease
MAGAFPRTGGIRGPRFPSLQRHVRCWVALWGIPDLDERLTIEWSPRLRRSLARAFPARNLVRLSPALLTAPRRLVLETLCHELAHVVVRKMHRGHRRPHGPEWAELVTAAGFPPRTRVPFASDTPTDAACRRRTTSRLLYLHACPVCHARRLARRRVTRWRCAACVAAGLEGRLKISVVEAPSP